MQILTDKWIPLRAETRIALDDALDRPIDDIQSGRPDFDFALVLMLIGLAQTGYQPPPLLGNEPRFLQGKKALVGNNKPIGSLLLDEPSENATRNNSDLFIKRGQRNAMCTPCAMLALYTHTQFCGPLGPGLYPGSLFHSTLYLRRKKTLRETVEANTVSVEIPPEAYFSSPNTYWLDDPSTNAECNICGAIGPVITTYWRSRGRDQSAPNPHCAHTPSGKRFAISPHNTLMDIIEGCSPGSTISTPPFSIVQRAECGDSVMAFGTFYNKATLRRAFDVQFNIRAPFERHALVQCARSIVNFSSSKLVTRRWESTFMSEIMENLSGRVCDGDTEIDAALAVYDLYCPMPNKNSRRYGLWRYWREQIAVAN